MAEPVLSVAGLSKSFGAVRASDDVSLELRAGEVHALIGPNGAGKSTLVAQIAGAVRPDAGRVRLLGRDVTALGVAARARLGLGRGFQVSAVVPGYDVLENVALAVRGRRGDVLRSLRAWRRDDDALERARLAIERVGLAGREHALAGELSHGERRRLELAATLALEPKALLLDEPMAGLGAEGADDMIRLIGELATTAPVLLVEHDMDVVFAVADRVTVLVDGAVLASGSGADVRGDARVRAAYLGDEAEEGASAKSRANAEEGTRAQGGVRAEEGARANVGVKAEGGTRAEEGTGTTGGAGAANRAQPQAGETVRIDASSPSTTAASHVAVGRAVTTGDATTSDRDVDTRTTEDPANGHRAHTAPGAALEMRGVSAFYGAAQALHGVDLVIRPGETLALLGRNGMGKTTTVRTICRLLSHADGEITLDGRSLRGLAAHRVARLGIGLVPEGRRCFADLSVEENLVAASRPGPWTFERVAALFPRLDERRTQRAATLSGGEQQMLAIGRALMTNPRLLVLDEATEGLAPLARREIRHAIGRLREEGSLSILVIDRSLAELRRVADRAVVLERGRSVWTGPMDALDERTSRRWLGV